MTTALILLPFGGALVVWLLPWSRYWAGSFGLLVALAEVGLWIETLIRFDFSHPGVQLDDRTSWFGDLGISYHVGLFGFSLWLIGMSVVVMAASIAYAFWTGRDRARAYFGLQLFLTGAIVGVFAAQDLLLFYAFFEAMLIPLYVLVGVWGGPGRLGATLKFVLYTMAGSLLMLAAIVVYGLSENTFDLVKISASPNKWVFLRLVSAALFLIAGMVERRTLTGELGRLGGMARGRPALATVLMTTGIIALAVPGSSAFAGEFLILAGVFQQGWIWAVIGAGAIVLAAMYMLRLISAVLHREVGPAVPDAALDLRPAELGFLVPLVACLLALSAWPAAVSHRSSGGALAREPAARETLKGTL